jgi:photosystem II stability/assembly factor-like uncharacterized protein
MQLRGCVPVARTSSATRKASGLAAGRSAPCLLAGLLAGCLLAAGCGTRTAAAPSPHVSAQPSASAAGQQSAGVTSAARGQFDPVAASFVTASTGWVLGDTNWAPGAAPCQSCAGLLHTSNGGRSWRALPAPPAPVGANASPADAITNIAFANAEDGFLYGPILLSSHDGGRSWVRVKLPPVQELVLGRRYAFAVTGAPFTAATGLWRTAVGSSRWTRLRLPGDLQHLKAGENWGGLQLEAEGRTLELLQQGRTGVGDTAAMVGRLWLSRNAGMSWQDRQVPCRPPADGGADVVSMAFGHPDAWLLDCFDNEQSSQEQDTQHHLYGSANGGLSWVRLPDPTAHNEPDLLADNGSGHAFLATEGVFDYLVGTFDGGLHWQVLIKSGGSFSGWADLDFVTTDIGFVVGPADPYDTVGPDHVYRTDDGGRTWQAMRL